VDAARPTLEERVPRATFVASELIGELSELAHPARAIAVFRRAGLPRLDPTQLAETGLATLAGQRSRQRGWTSTQRRCAWLGLRMSLGGLRRSDRVESATSFDGRRLPRAPGRVRAGRLGAGSGLSLTEVCRSPKSIFRARFASCSAPSVRACPTTLRPDATSWRRFHWPVEPNLSTSALPGRWLFTSAGAGPVDHQPPPKPPPKPPLLRPPIELDNEAANADLKPDGRLEFPSPLAPEPAPRTPRRVLRAQRKHCSAHYLCGGVGGASGSAGDCGAASTAAGVESVAGVSAPGKLT